MSILCNGHTMSVWCPCDHNIFKNRIKLCVHINRILSRRRGVNMTARCETQSRATVLAWTQHPVWNPSGHGNMSPHWLFWTTLEAYGLLRRADNYWNKSIHNLCGRNDTVRTAFRKSQVCLASRAIILTAAVHCDTIKIPAGNQILRTQKAFCVVVRPFPPVWLSLEKLTQINSPSLPLPPRPQSPRHAIGADRVQNAIL